MATQTWVMVWLQEHFAKTQQVVKQSAGVGCSKISERQRSRGMRTGAYTEFGNTGISDVSGSSAMTSGIDSSGTRTGVIGTSLDVEGPPY